MKGTNEAGCESLDTAAVTRCRPATRRARPGLRMKPGHQKERSLDETSSWRPLQVSGGTYDWVRTLTSRIRAVRPEPSDLGKAAVNDQVDAVDEAGVRGGEEQRGGRDLFAGSEPSQGDEGLDLLAEFG
jgi:hypothetical protein